MKLSYLILLGLLFSCKPQERNDSPQYPSVSQYQPNPDEVVLLVKLVESTKTDLGWDNTAEIVQQLKSGSGFRNRLRSGEQLVINSSEKISHEEFYCSVEYQIGMNNSGTYTLRSLLSK